MSRAEAIEAAKQLIGFDELPALLTLNQFAELTQLAPKTCRNRASLGLEPKPIKLGSRLRYPRLRIAIWVADNGLQGTRF